MPTIIRESLLSLEAYARERAAIRRRTLEHKRARSVALGPHVTLLFEDETTIRYQIQEMLRVERIFEEDGIEAELETYNPLVPDGSNLKATMMIEYEDAGERARALARLVGVEDRTYVEVVGFARVLAIADEDLDRDTADKTSAVHFLRFEFTPAMIVALRAGAALAVGIEHPEYAARVAELPPAVRASLLADFAPAV
jgi:hypothetical protein